VTVPTQAERGGPAEVLYVLCLMQAGFLLLAGLGETLLMGNGLYLVVPVAKATAVLVLAAKAARARRWALIGLIVVQGITLLGFWIQVAVGLTPWVDFTVNLAVLITNVALPAGLILMAARLIRFRPKVVVAYRVRRDPQAPAPLVPGRSR
jgi:hypothetical protein